MRPVGKGIVIVTAVATMAIAGACRPWPRKGQGEMEPIKCVGSTSGRARGAARAPSTMKGKNAGKGKGFVETKTVTECDQRGETVQSSGHGDGGAVPGSRRRAAGAGLSAALDGTARVDWFEVISENFMVAGVVRGPPSSARARSRPSSCTASRCPSVPPIRSTTRTSGPCGALVRRVEPAWVSDHLCWSGVGGHYAHDLLPLPYTEEALAHVVIRVVAVQERLGAKFSSRTCRATHPRPLDPGGVGVPRGGGRARRLWALARRQQRLRQRDQSRLLGGGVPGRAARRSRRPDSSRRAHRHGRLSLRHARRAGDRAGVGSLPGGCPPVRRASTLVEWDEHIPELDVVCVEAERARAVEAEALEGAMLSPRELELRFLARPPRAPRGWAGWRRASIPATLSASRAIAAASPRLAAPRHLRGHVPDAPRRRASRGLPSRAGHPRRRGVPGARVPVPRSASLDASVRSIRGTPVRRLLLAGEPSGLPFLGDLARLEWARVEVFDAPGADPLPSVGPRRPSRPRTGRPLRLRPIPACLVVECAWPAHEIWAAADDAALDRSREWLGGQYESASGARAGA